MKTILKQKYNLTAIAICLLFFFLALFSSTGLNWKNLKYSGNGILADEIPHISSGYYYLKTHRYFLNPEHPPLVKDIAGLGEMVIHPSLPNITSLETLPADFHRAEFPFENSSFPKALEWQNNQDHFGTMFLFQPGNDPDRIAFWARLAVITANTLLLLILFWLLKILWNARAALLGLFFFAVSGFSIAHGSYVVIDFMSAVLSVIAILCFALYLKKFSENERTGKYFWLASASLALALLSKFSSVVLVPALFLGGLIFAVVLGIKSQRFWRDRISIVLKYIFSFIAVSTVAAVFISAFYAFHVYRMEDYMLVQKINENFPEEKLPAIGHKVLEFMVYANVFTKGLAAYINGVFMVVSRMVVSAQNTYFMGHVYGNEGAGLRYFPMLYFAKLSPGLHLFSVLTLVLIISAFIRRKKEKFKIKLLKAISNPSALLLWVFIICYMGITLRSTFQIGLRHIMPVILAAAVLTGRGVDIFWDKSLLRVFRLKHLFVIVAALMIFSVWYAFPYYLEYYNFLAGGVDNGYKIATDSNYDWGGSDVRRLADWVKDNDIQKIYTQIFADVPLKYYFGDKQIYYNLQDEGKLPPSGSFIAVSIFEYMNNIYSDSIPPERKYTILQNNLSTRVGKTILIFAVP